MPNTPSPSHSQHSRKEGSGIDISDLADFSQDPLTFIPSSLPECPLGVSVPTQMVEDALLSLEQMSDVDLNIFETDTSPGDRYRLLEATYNDLLHLYREDRSQLEQLSEEHAECKPRFKQLGEEHTELGDRYELLRAAYNDLVRLYMEDRSHLEQLSGENADCKARLKKLSEEHTQLKSLYLDVSDTFKVLLFSFSDALAAGEGASASADGAAPGHHSESAVHGADLSLFPLPPFFAPTIPAIQTSLLPAAAKGHKEKGKKRQVLESPDEDGTHDEPAIKKCRTTIESTDDAGAVSGTAASLPQGTSMATSTSGREVTQPAAPHWSLVDYYNTTRVPLSVMKELRKKRYLRTQKMKPDDTGRTARDFCAIDWCALHPEGTVGEFNWYYDNLPAEEAEAYEQKERDAKEAWAARSEGVPRVLPPRRAPRAPVN